MSGPQSSIADRLTALSSAQRELLARRLAEESGIADAHARQPRRAGRLVAFVVPRDGQSVEPDALRAYLESRLPRYMVPHGFEPLGALPRTVAGKIDRQALARISTSAGRTEPEGPSVSSGSLTDAEQILAGIWCEVLGLSEVGVDEDFLELGGDSLLSIRVLARASQQGLRICAEDFFAHPTVAGQAASAGIRLGPQAEQGPVTGPVTLTPIQHWFFERIATDPQHWNQSLLFRLTRPLDVSTLERAVQAVLTHHDALRIEFGEGAPLAQRIGAPDASVPVSELDLRALADDEVEARIEAHASLVNASLDLEKGPLLRVVLIRTSEGRTDRLLIVAHHLVVDAVSWDLLVADLESAWEQAEQAAGITLGAKSTSFKSWSERLVGHAQTDAVRDELAHWRAIAAEVFHLPIDHEGPGSPGRFSSLRTLTRDLDPDDTRAVLRELPGAFNCLVNEVLIAALAMAIRRWSGASRIRLDLEGHGRDAPFEELDVSRTIGWFTTVYPVALSLPPTDEPVAVLAEIKEQLRSIPSQGLGYGLLRELSGDTAVRQALRGDERSELLFNYIGRMDRDGDPDSRLVLERDVCGVPRNPNGLLAYRLEINARVNDSRLEFLLGYSDTFHRESSIAELADDLTGSLRALVSATRRDDANVFTPSDFPLADLDQSDLDGLARAIDAVDSDPDPS
jgi:non-ribosomal peptide synthase protein (TIGR01720 family)